MAVIRQRMYKKVAQGYNILHMETDSTCVLMSNGQTLETAINNKADKDHNHSEYATVTWVQNNFQPKGGTSVTPPVDPTPSVPTTIGASYSFAGYGWTVVHVESDRVYLMMSSIHSITAWVDGYDYVGGYSGSALHDTVRSFENSISSYLSKAVSTTVAGITSKVFIATYQQIGGGYVPGRGYINGSFSYFADGSNKTIRGATYQGQATGWFIHCSDNTLYLMYADGPATEVVNNSFRIYSYDNPSGDQNQYNGYTETGGFRPFVALKR